MRRLEGQQTSTDLGCVAGVWSLVEVDLEFGNGAWRGIFLRKNFRKQEMDLREARTHIESSRLQSAFLRIINSVEVEIGDSVVKIGFGVVEGVEVENVALYT